MIFPYLSEDGVREIVIVVGVTSSSTTLGGSGGGGAEDKIFTRNNRLILVYIYTNVQTIHSLGRTQYLRVSSKHFTSQSVITRISFACKNQM